MVQTMRFLSQGIGWIVRSIVYLVFGTLLVAALIATATAAHVWYFARQDNHDHANTIFVLGAAQYDGRPSEWLAARLQHAADLYEEGVAPTIVTVGGKREGDRFTEAQAGKDYLVNTLDVPSNAVVEVNEGVDTLTSAEAFATMARDNGWTSAVVVTDPAHSLRATRMVQDQGIIAWGSPTRQGPSVATRSAQFNSILHETGGMLYYEVIERERPGLRINAGAAEPVINARRSSTPW